jgi:hypothetical protein
MTSWTRLLSKKSYRRLPAVESDSHDHTPVIVCVTVSQVSQVANEPSYLTKPSQLLSVSVARQSSLTNDLTKIISYLASYFTKLIKPARSVDPGLLDQF